MARVKLSNASHVYTNEWLLQANIRALLLTSVELWVGIKIFADAAKELEATERSQQL